MHSAALGQCKYGMHVVSAVGSPECDDMLFTHCRAQSTGVQLLALGAGRRTPDDDDHIG